MVALASRDVAAARRRSLRWSWSGATAAVLVAGVAVRLALNPVGVGDRSAAVMMVVLGLGTWATTALLATSRANR